MVSPIVVPVLEDGELLRLPSHEKICGNPMRRNGIKGNCQQPKEQEPQIILHPAGQVVFEYPLGYQKNSDDTADKYIAY